MQGNNEIRQTGRALRSYLNDRENALPGTDAVRRARQVAVRMESDGVLHATDAGVLIEYLGWYDWRASRVVAGLDDVILATLER